MEIADVVKENLTNTPITIQAQNLHVQWLHLVYFPPASVDCTYQYTVHQAAINHVGWIVYP